ncbi:hypothetical protein OBBRIDRAFT_765738 [Obba rivulosa]|uniref:Cell cycle checkpoint control protein n=1 Tax=Obba rivulosa TaxID=1052685 RepID=A0A8E2DV89_9APHY|nr:hypothetical protein OBBRIDRAFT_765738 [Obba rivulosa]
MQAVLDAASLKHLTRALTCLAKYGDELTVHATPERLTISSTNSSQSAYGRFRYPSTFFSRYRVTAEPGPSDVEEVPVVAGQLPTKSLLTILRHRGVEKTVDKCELSLHDGGIAGQDDEESDTLESRLTVRLHCKHGVIKTHRLLLQAPTGLLAPGAPDAPHESRATIGPRALKDMLEHFPSTKGAKGDAQLVWTFGDTDVQVRSFETGSDAKGVPQLSTELTISADEFDTYSVYPTPFTIAFHLREFSGTIAFAEGAALPLALRFTDPAAPLFIDLPDDPAEVLFVLATTRPPGGASQIRSTRGASAVSPPVVQRAGSSASSGNAQRAGNNSDAGPRDKGKKRAREEDADLYAEMGANGTERSAPERPRPRPRPVVRRAEEDAEAPESMLPPSFAHPLYTSTPQPRTGVREATKEKEPLFLPSSQLSQASQAAIRESGLGIEHMSMREFEDMLEGDGEDVMFDDDAILNNGGDFGGGIGDGDFGDEGGGDGRERGESLEIVEEEEWTQLEPTQRPKNTRAFRPLFED